MRLTFSTRNYLCSDHLTIAILNHEPEREKEGGEGGEVGERRREGGRGILIHTRQVLAPGVCVCICTAKTAVEKGAQVRLMIFTPALC